MTKILIDRSVVEQALEALEFANVNHWWGSLTIEKAITHLRAALAQQAEPVEPVGYLPAYELDRLQSGHDGRLRSAKFGASVLDGDVAVYTTPPQRPAEPEYPLGQASTDVGVPVYVVKKAEPQEPCNKSCAPGYCYCDGIKEAT